MATTGYVDFTSYATSSSASGTLTMRVNWSQEVNETDNTSTITITSIQLKSSGSYGSTIYGCGLIKINGNTVVTMTGSSHSLYVSQSFKDINGTLGSVTIPHNADGTLTVTVSIEGGTQGSTTYEDFWWEDTSSPIWGWYFKATSASVEGETNSGWGVVYIDNGSSFDAYEVYIDNGSSWDRYIPYIDNGSSWDLIS